MRMTYICCGQARQVDRKDDEEIRCPECMKLWAMGTHDPVPLHGCYPDVDVRTFKEGTTTYHVSRCLKCGHEFVSAGYSQEMLDAITYGRGMRGWFRKHVVKARDWISVIRGAIKDCGVVQW